MVDGFDDQGQPSRLSSQRFYDDCAGMLQTDGILVVNLHHWHHSYDRQLERIQRSFSNAVLVVEGGEQSNIIVFAFKGPGLAPLRPGRVRRPRHLDATAAKQLQAAFALVASALKDPER
jgi:spermidine synthase